jgi:hypothetical protein
MSDGSTPEQLPAVRSGVGPLWINGPAGSKIVQPHATLKVRRQAAAAYVARDPMLIDGAKLSALVPINYADTLR